MTNRDAAPETTTSQRISRRTVSATALAAGFAVPAAIGLGASAAAQATPVGSSTPTATSGRVAIEPGDLFSGAIVANGFVFTSGMLGLDPATNELAGDDITSQTQQALANLEAVLTAAGSSMDRVVKATCMLANLDDFQAFNEVYAGAFPSEPPARSTFQAAGLALGALVEIELIAII